MNTVSIYTLSNPTDGLVRYIGRTKGSLHTRLIQHLSDARTGKRNNKRICWIKSLMNKNIHPVIEEIDSVPENQVSFFEKHYIKLYKSIGAVLVNDTEGGEGVKGRKMTEENKRNLSNSLKGRVFSDEHKRKLSLSNSRRWKNGYRHSPELIEKIRAGHKKKPILMFDNNGVFVNRFESIRGCEREAGLDSAMIVHCLKGKVRHVNGFKFKYA